MPKLSVIMSVFNGEPYLGNAVESILNQSFEDFEFIIINDGSTDHSKDIIENFAEHDSRVIFHHQKNKGLIDSLNLGLNMSKAPLIARMDSDDISLPDRFEKQIRYLNDHPNVAVLGGATQLIDETGNPIRENTYPTTVDAVRKMLLEGSAVAHPAVMGRQNVLSNLGYRSAYRHAEDYDLWLRISENHDICNLPDTVLLYRQHPNKISFQHRYQQALATMVAKQTHLMRNAGLEDPTAFMNEMVTANTLLELHEETPNLLESKFGLLDLAMTHNNLNETLSLNAQILEELDLDHASRHHPMLLRAAVFIWKSGHKIAAIKSTLNLFWTCPRQTTKTILQKLRHRSMGN